MTPYVRRSKAHSNNKEESNTYTKKDSVSLEIEKKRNYFILIVYSQLYLFIIFMYIFISASERIRRSQAKKVQSLT